MTAQHTPSNLQADQSPNDLDKFLIIELHPTKPGKRYTLAEVEAFDRETTERYAKMFAAAPDMLAALREMVAECDHGTHDAGTSGMVKARAAIAKAEGRTE